MSETTVTKPCTKCKQIKPFIDFYKQKSHKDGYASWCKTCKNKAVKQYRYSEPGNAIRAKYEQSKQFKAAIKKAYSRYNHSKKGLSRSRRAAKNHRIKYPGKEKAHRAINNAVQNGKLPNIATLCCVFDQGNKYRMQAQEYHHYLGYEPEHWLDVIPVCKECHKILHQNLSFSN